MKRDVSESLILPHGLINRKQAGGCEGFSIIITLKEKGDEKYKDYCSEVGRARVN